MFKPKPAGKPSFSREQVADDTERDMRGRKQRFGAAMQDDEPEGDEAAAPAPAAAAPGGDGMVPSTVSDQGAEQTDPVAALQAENVELKSRLEAIESKLGIGQKPPVQQGEEEEQPEIGFGEEGD